MGQSTSCLRPGEAADAASSVSAAGATYAPASPGYDSEARLRPPPRGSRDAPPRHRPGAPYGAPAGSAPPYGRREDGGPPPGGRKKRLGLVPRLAPRGSRGAGRYEDDGGGGGRRSRGRPRPRFRLGPRRSRSPADRVRGGSGGRSPLSPYGGDGGLASGDGEDRSAVGDLADVLSLRPGRGDPGDYGGGAGAGGLPGGGPYEGRRGVHRFLFGAGEDEDEDEEEGADDGGTDDDGSGRGGAGGRDGTGGKARASPLRVRDVECARPRRRDGPAEGDAGAEGSVSQPGGTSEARLGESLSPARSKSPSGGVQARGALRTELVTRTLEEMAREGVDVSDPAAVAGTQIYAVRTRRGGASVAAARPGTGTGTDNEPAQELGAGRSGRVAGGAGAASVAAAAAAVAGAVRMDLRRGRSRGRGGRGGDAPSPPPFAPSSAASARSLGAPRRGGSPRHSAASRSASPPPEPAPSSSTSAPDLGCRHPASAAAASGRRPPPALSVFDTIILQPPTTPPPPPPPPPPPQSHPQTRRSGPSDRLPRFPCKLSGGRGGGRSHASAPGGGEPRAGTGTGTGTGDAAVALAGGGAGLQGAAAGGHTGAAAEAKGSYATRVFGPEALRNSDAEPVDEILCVDPHHRIYVMDVGLSPRECDGIISTSERCSGGQYAAYTYAKQTLGCREYDELAAVCLGPVMTCCATVGRMEELDRLRQEEDLDRDGVDSGGEEEEEDDDDDDDDSSDGGGERGDDGGAGPAPAAGAGAPSSPPPREPPRRRPARVPPPPPRCLVLDDREPHMVKYDISRRERQKLDMHTDKSEWTFLISLSEGCGADYEGGGTYFEGMDSTVHLQRGHALLFPGRLRHRGQKITGGTRFLLVGFLVDKDGEDRGTGAGAGAGVAAGMGAAALQAGGRK